MKSAAIPIMVFVATIGWYAVSPDAAVNRIAWKSEPEKQQQAPRRERALEVLSKAEQLVEQETHPAIKAELLSSMAVVYAKLGQISRVDKLLARSRDLIEENDDTSKACYECPTKEFFRILIAIDHAQAGQVEQASQILEQIVRSTQEQSDIGSGGQMLAGLASVFANIGKSERALQLLDEAFELSRTRNNKTDYSNVTVLEEIAKRYVAAGQLDRATRIAALIEQGPVKDHALIAIAKKNAEIGRFDIALRLQNEVETVNFKPDILTFVAKQYLKQGQKEKAAALLRKALSASGGITVENLKQLARHDVAILLAEAGQINEALQVVKKTDASLPRLRLLAQMSPVLARAGRLQLAEKMLSEAYELNRSSKGWYFQAHEICEVARAYAALGRKERATQLLSEAIGVLEALDDRSNNDSALVEVAESYLDLGDYDKALQTVERIGDATRAKVMTLLMIAARCAGADQLMDSKDRIVEELMRP